MPESRKKLLIVDDSKVSRMVIRSRISAIHPDWKILEAINGDEAILISKQESPDYCTMDINMPGILGTDAAQQIIQTHPAIRIVIFSANIQESFLQRAAAIGAGFVAKPATEKSISQTLAYFSV